MEPVRLHQVTEGYGSCLEDQAVNYGSVEIPQTRVRLHFFRRDVRVEIIGRPRIGAGGDAPVHLALGPFSKKSQKRLVFIGANTQMDWHSLLTVTYPEIFPTDGREAREHLRMLLQAMQREQGLVGYLWVREFQGRGAPHYHILTDVIHTGENRLWYRAAAGNDPGAWGDRAKHDWVSVRWQEIIKAYSCLRGMLAGCRWEVLRSAEGGAAYLAAYASKAEQKVVPAGFSNPGRWWGHARCVAVAPPYDVVDVPLAEYMAMTEGEVASPDGWLYTTLHDGRRRAFRWLPPQETLPGLGGEAE